MTVIFQLFCAEDLQKLSLEQLDDLRTIIRNALGTSSIALEVSTDTRLPQDTPPIKAALNKRFHEVSQQMKSSPPNSAQFDFNGLLDRHFTRGDEQAKEERILEWAISCEVNNFKFYNQLVLLKQRADEFFYDATGGQRPKGPDSPYSPFNPQHPLYTFYYGLSYQKPNPTQGGADSSS